LLQPYYKNFKKRIIKTPKLYFYDTGLVCWLLEITSKKDLDLSPFKGALFETFVMSELMKINYNQALNKTLYYWRDSNGNETDCILEQAGNYTAVEIKSTKTFRKELLKGLNYWKNLNPALTKKSYLIYSGNQTYKHDSSSIINWMDMKMVFKSKK
jgi:hypothetical protein